MVKEVTKEGKIYYQCEACKFCYKTQELAKKCEAFCKRNNACSTEITRHAVKV